MANRSTALGIVGGAVAGLAATWLMGKATTYLYEKESTRARDAEDAARGGETAFATAARKLAAGFGIQLSDAQRSRYGLLLHWGIGASSGLVYGLVRSRYEGRPVRDALLFGGGMFLVMDEAVNYLFGLTPGPTAFPWQAHARGLAGHLVFGAATEATLDLFNAVAA